MARAPRLSLNRVVVGKYDLVRSVSMDGCVSERPRYSVSRAYDCFKLARQRPVRVRREEALAAHERHHGFALALTHGVRDDLERRPGLDERDLHELRAEVDADHVRGRHRGDERHDDVAEQLHGALLGIRAASTARCSDVARKDAADACKGLQCMRASGVATSSKLEYAQAGQAIHCSRCAGAQRAVGCRAYGCRRRHAAHRPRQTISRSAAPSVVHASWRASRGRVAVFLYRAGFAPPISGPSGKLLAWAKPRCYRLHIDLPATD